MSATFGPSAYVGAIVHGNPVSAINRGGTIAAGGAAQTLMAANLVRRGFELQNLSTGDLWISEFGDAAASQPSKRIAAGALYETPAHACPTAAISIFGATTGQAFAAREW